MSVNVAYENAPLFPAEVTQLKDKYLVVAKDLNDGKVHVGLIPEINNLGELKDQSEGALALKNVRAYVQIQKDTSNNVFQNSKISAGFDKRKLFDTIEVIKESMGDKAYENPKELIDTIASSALMQTMQVNMLMNREFISPLEAKKTNLCESARSHGIQTEDESLKKSIESFAQGFRFKSHEAQEFMENPQLIEHVKNKHGLNEEEAKNKIRALLYEARKNLGEVSVTSLGNQGIGLTDSSKDNVTTAFNVTSTDEKGGAYKASILRAQLEITKVNVDGSFQANLTYGINKLTSSPLPFGVKTNGSIPVQARTDDLLKGALFVNEASAISGNANEARLMKDIVVAYQDKFKEIYDLAVNKMMSKIPAIDEAAVEALGARKYKEARLEAMDAEDAGKEYNLLPKEDYISQARVELSGDVKKAVDNIGNIFRENIGINSYHQVSTLIAQALMNTKDMNGNNMGNASISYMFNNIMNSDISDGVNAKEFSEVFKDKINQAYANISTVYGADFKSPEHGIKAETVEVKAPVSNEPQAKNDLEIN